MLHDINTWEQIGDWAGSLALTNILTFIALNECCPRLLPTSLETVPRHPMTDVTSVAATEDRHNSQVSQRVIIESRMDNAGANWLPALTETRQGENMLVIPTLGMIDFRNQVPRVRGEVDNPLTTPHKVADMAT